MMRYKEAIPQEINLGDPFQRIHNFRPLLPNPYLGHLHKHHHDFGNNKGLLLEEGCKEGSAQQVMVSSRWNPTPEQLTALEELYRCGTRTPSAEQIQHITSQLRRYGKIEGKNVFYWFQNHKARERQKRRRQHQLHVTTTHANDKGFEDGEKNCKRAPFISNNKESNYNPPILSTTGPKTADVMTSSDKLFEFHQISTEFQHNYYPNNTFCSKKDLFLSEHRNATWPSQVNTSQPSSNNYSHAPLQLFSISSKLNSSSQEPRNHFPENVVDDGGDSGEPTVALTLQLFPLVKQAQNEDIMDNKSEDTTTTKENIISCMVSDDFVPYYQFL